MTPQAPLWLWQFLRLFLFCFDILDRLKDSWLIKYFIECPSVGIHLMFFSWFDWSYEFLEGTWFITLDINLNHLAEIVFIRLGVGQNVLETHRCKTGRTEGFLCKISTHKKVTPFHIILWKKVLLCHLNLRGSSAPLPTKGWNTYINYLEFCMRDLSTIYLYLPIYLSIYNGTYSWIFIY